jgi:hypothetical protein
MIATGRPRYSVLPHGAMLLGHPGSIMIGIGLIVGRSERQELTAAVTEPSVGPLVASHDVRGAEIHHDPGDIEQRDHTGIDLQSLLNLFTCMEKLRRQV